MDSIERIVELKDKEPASIDAAVLYKLPKGCVEVRRRRGAVVAFGQVNPMKSDDNGYYERPAGANYVHWPDMEVKAHFINYGEPTWYTNRKKILEP